MWHRLEYYVILWAMKSLNLIAIKLFQQNGSWLIRLTKPIPMISWTMLLSKGQPWQVSCSSLATLSPLIRLTQDHRLCLRQAQPMETKWKPIVTHPRCSTRQFNHILSSKIAGFSNQLFPLTMRTVACGLLWQPSGWFGYTACLSKKDCLFRSHWQSCLLSKLQNHCLMLCTWACVLGIQWTTRMSSTCRWLGYQWLPSVTQSIWHTSICCARAGPLLLLN